MPTVNLGIHSLLKIKNAVQFIRNKTTHLEKNYDFRKHGINPLYNDIIKKCELIEAVLAQQSIDTSPAINRRFAIEYIGEEINQNYSTVSKRKKKNALLCNRQTNEWRIPIDVIPATFGIPGEIESNQGLTGIFKPSFDLEIKKRKKYLYLKMEKKQ